MYIREHETCISDEIFDGVLKHLSQIFEGSRVSDEITQQVLEGMHRKFT